MIPRHFYHRFNELLSSFPIVTILGPRQCGKTNFIKKALPSWHYLDLEKPSDWNYITQDPEQAFKDLKSGFILDEAQSAPKIFSVLRSHVDENRKARGQVVLLGSASPQLIRHASETLAGRTGFLDMTPFQWQEISKIKKTSLDSLWLRGGFPDAYLAVSDRRRLDWFEAYTRTFIERDLFSLGMKLSPPMMRKLMHMLANYNGGIWNASQIASSLGTSYHTINNYTDILEQTYLIRKLQPYYSNIGKRLIKSPKLYFRDTGLLHFFLGVNSSLSLMRSPVRGSSWESFIIEQLLSLLAVRYPGTQSYYWRTSSGEETDLLIDFKGKLIPFEVKLHTAPQRSDLHGLYSCMHDLKLPNGYVIYPGEKDCPIGEGVKALSAARLLNSDFKLN